MELHDKIIARLQRSDRWLVALEYHSELSGVMDECVFSFGQRDPGIPNINNLTSHHFRWDL